MICNSRTWKNLLFILLLWAWPALALGVTPPVPAQPHQYVVDLAGVMDNDTQVRLNAMLHELEVKTTAQVVVLTINSLDGEAIESFSHETAVKWGIGQKGKDNGVLLTVAVKDHKYRFEVGYGLESTLPDSLVGSLGRDYLAPNFRKGNYAMGIVIAMNELVKTISGGKVAADAIVTGAPVAQQETKKENTDNPALILTIVGVIFGLGAVAFIIPRLLRRASGGVWFSGSGGSSGWSSGSSDSSSFSGGGGDFGGGGASGDW